MSCGEDTGRIYSLPSQVVPQGTQIEGECAQGGKDGTENGLDSLREDRQQNDEETEEILSTGLVQGQTAALHCQGLRLGYGEDVTPSISVHKQGGTTSRHPHIFSGPRGPNNLFSGGHSGV